jgi:hypothetical protein
MKIFNMNKIYIMELENEDIDLKFKNPEEYINKLDEFNGIMKLLLDDFKKDYVNAKMYPNNQDIQAKYQNTISNINQTQSKLFSMSNDIQGNIDDINKQISDLNQLIAIERNKNKEVRKKLEMIEDKHNSALEMISDYKEIYQINYLRNWALFLSTIICIFTIKAVYKNQ